MCATYWEGQEGRKLFELFSIIDIFILISSKPKPVTAKERVQRKCVSGRTINMRRFLQFCGDTWTNVFRDLIICREEFRDRDIDLYRVTMFVLNILMLRML